MNMYTLLAFGLYVGVLYAIGFYFYYKNKNASDFIGNRSINYWVTAIGAQASDMSSWLMLGFPATVYKNGLFELWTAFGLVVCMYINWHYVAPRLRIITGSFRELTLSAFFAHQFNDKHGYLRLISALVCVQFFTFYIASGLVGMGRIFESVFEIDYQYGVVIGIITACAYTLLGGFTAVAWSNLFQGFFLLGMVIIVPLCAYFTLPHGFATIINAAHAHHVPLTLWDSNYTVTQALLLALSWGLGYFGQPHILVYFMGIDDPNKIKYAKYVGITWQIVALTAATCVGLVGLGFFAVTPEPLDLLFVYMAQALFHPLLVGFVLCGILAAVLTTMNGHILIVGSVIANDIYARRKNTASTEHIVAVSRIGSLAVSAGALAISFHNNSSIYNLVNYAWSGLGSAFGPLVLAGLYCKNISYRTALCGLIAGTTIAALWPYTGSTLFPLIPGFLANCITLCVANLFFK